MRVCVNKHMEDIGLVRHRNDYIRSLGDSPARDWLQFSTESLLISNLLMPYPPVMLYFTNILPLTACSGNWNKVDKSVDCLKRTV